MNIFITKIKSFFSQYKWLLFPILLILIFLYIIIYIFYSQKPHPTYQVGQRLVHVTPTNSPTVYQNTIYPSSSSGYQSALAPFKEEPLSTVTLPDGSVKNDYESDDDQRSDIRILHNGVIIFQRTHLPDSKVDSYQNLINNPEYTSQGSSFYGQYVTIYADPSKGTAILVAPQIGLVLEEYTFPPLSVNDYVRKYGRDISNYQVTPEPTLVP